MTAQEMTAAPATGAQPAPASEVAGTPAALPRIQPPLPVTGTYNFRDLGGLPLTAGGTVRRGQVFRSDALHRVDDTGRTHMAGLGIRRVVDLRHDEELARMPSALDTSTLEVIHAPVFAAAAIDAQLDPGMLLDLEGIYRMMIDTRGPQLTLAARHVALSPGPVVFHCTAGKDRTGVLAALLLDAVGVEREAVIADYAATEANLSGAWAQAALAGKDIAALEAAGMDIVGITTQSPARLIASALERVDEEFGGTAAYLHTHGFDADALEAAHRRLVA